MAGLRRLAERAGRRPFGRLEAWFYVRAVAPGVTTLVTPVLRTATEGVGSLVVDLGCGDGAMTAGLGRTAVGVEPSPHVLRRRHRGPGQVPVARARAEALPVGTASVGAVMSSCALKHWSDRSAVLDEAARVLRPGGILALVEVEGRDPAELARLVAIVRLPALLRPAYAAFVRRALTLPTPPVEVLADEVAAAGFEDVRTGRIEGQPFVTLTARRPPP